MKSFKTISLISFVLFFCSTSYAASADKQMQTKTQLFKKLSDVNIDQVVELPYNFSLVSKIGKQVQVHNISKMQSGVLPEPTSLVEEFNSSFEYYNQREVLKSFSYRVGKGSCAYMEAIKVSEVLVCYRRAQENTSVLAPISRSGPKCVTTMSRLTHCYIFAHQIDDVLKAISE
jgi:hypothetical protein